MSCWMYFWMISLYGNHPWLEQNSKLKSCPLNGHKYLEVNRAIQNTSIYSIAIDSTRWGILRARGSSHSRDKGLLIYPAMFGHVWLFVESPWTRRVKVTWLMVYIPGLFTLLSPLCPQPGKAMICHQCRENLTESTDNIKLQLFHVLLRNVTWLWHLSRNVTYLWHNVTWSTRFVLHFVTFVTYVWHNIMWQSHFVPSY